MSEQEIREGLRVAVWDEPPLDFDPDALMERAEKLRSRRRALVSVGVGTALVVVSAFSLPMFLNGSRPDSANTANSPTRTSSPAQQYSGKRDELVGVVEQVLPKLVPGAHSISPAFTDDRGVVLTPPSSTAMKTVPRDKTFYVRFEDGIGPTAIQLEFDGTSYSCQSAALCRDEPQPDGTKVAVVEHVEGGETSMASVTHVRGDGKSVTVTAFQYNPVTGLGLRKTVPMGVGELRALATDSRLVWTD